MGVCSEYKETNSVTKNCKPISLDLKSIYTNIPVDEGIEVFRIELDKCEDQTIPTEFLIRFLRLVLENNIFELNKELLSFPMAVSRS